MCECVKVQIENCELRLHLNCRDSDFPSISCTTKAAPVEDANKRADKQSPKTNQH